MKYYDNPGWKQLEKNIQSQVKHANQCMTLTQKNPDEGEVLIIFQGHCEKELCLKINDFPLSNLWNIFI